MIIVTGTPRCGSSLMMNCMINLLGIENVVGQKFPKRNEQRAFLIHEKVRTPAGVTEREYRQESKRKDLDRKKFNPNGYYEDRYVMRGFSYDERGLDHFEELENSPGKVLKLMGNGLANTHPKHVDKLIICFEFKTKIATKIFLIRCHIMC